MLTISMSPDSSPTTLPMLIPEKDELIMGMGCRNGREGCNWGYD